MLRCMHMEQEEQSLPWFPVLFGGTLIVGVVIAAIVLPRGKEVSYQKSGTTPPAPLMAREVPPAPVVPLPPPVSTTPDVEITRISPRGVANGTVIEGKARGNWFFEASFPIELRDNTGALLATAIAQAEGSSGRGRRPQMRR